MTPALWQSKALLAWFDDQARPLAFRQGPRDPYRVWLSEVMLQQTRIAQGLPYYERFLAALPTVEALAAAPLEQVYALWQGLGYYSRARSLHRAAVQIATRINEGKGWPSTYTEWLAIPGVGPYTAAAIASMAFGEAAPAVDGNVLRVGARYGALEGDILLPATARQVRELVAPWIDPDRPGDTNMALMELGAIVCTVRRPQCLLCPLAPGCAARELGLTDRLPVRGQARQPSRDTPKAPALPRRQLRYLLITDGAGRLYLQQRPTGDFWAGLYEPLRHEPTDPDSPLPEDLPATAWDLPPSAVNNRSPTLGLALQIRQKLSHRDLTIGFYGPLTLDDSHWAARSETGRWVAPGEALPPLPAHLARALSQLWPHTP